MVNFFKTDRDFCRELYMGPTEFKNAKKTLVKMGIISTKRKNTPAKTYYLLNTKRLIDLITSNVDLSKSVSMKPPNLLVENQPTTTENTTESTIYAPSYQNGTNKDTISYYLNNNPSESEDVNKAIQCYLDHYVDLCK
ncbi:MAG: hypothetical protein UZ20_WS6002000647 [candidate division WS6 bacterium OLB21]|uniref:Uncharacterized protein n=1 Tax=candidate division WS6 bacterium OLB21 TaxID=1617427 RepID=A0A136KIG7_9BACT|nr:MAG: hypothetical protein UZ20_WS6002000647 [candidate division WS6 bacterium OLB21]